MHISLSIPQFSHSQLLMTSTQWKLFTLGLMGSIMGGSCLLVFSVNAQIIPDNTLGNENSVVNPQETIRGIPSNLIEGGAIRGANLFHSFQEFNIPEGYGAYFANPNNIINIFSRVTGGNISQIMGRLGVLGNSNLFLINPNGIIFGSNASLDIAGSFVGSTANSIVFNNGFGFSATNPTPVPLLTLNLTPGLQTGNINPSSTLTNRGQLKTGNDLTLIAGQLDLQNKLIAGGNLTLQALDTVKIRDSIFTPFVGVAQGNLLIQGNQSIDIFTLNHQNSGLYAGENITLRSANPINGDAHYWSGGNFRIEQLDNNLGDLKSEKDPIIRARGDVTFDSYTGSSLHILAGGKVTITGDIIITGADESNGLTEEITLSDGRIIQIDGKTQPTLDIRAGTTAFEPIDVVGETVDFFPQEPDSSDNATGADITLNDVFIDAPDGLVFLTNQYQPNLKLTEGNIQVNRIFTDDFAFSGNGGSVFLDARGQITVGRTIFTRSSTGNAGDITLIANDDITVERGGSLEAQALLGGNIILKSQGNISITDGLVESSSFTDSTDVTGGNIEVSAQSLNLIDSSQLGILTEGGANAGNLVVKTSESISLSGVGSRPINGIYNQAGETKGNGGNLTLQTGDLRLMDGSTIITSTGGSGDGGDLNIEASKIEVIGIDNTFTTSIYAVSQRGSSGDAGNLEIKTGSLQITRGGQISTSTFGSGKGGNLEVKADLVEVVGTTSDGQFSSRLESRVEKESTGVGGNLSIDTRHLVIREGGQVSTTIFGQGNAGNLSIKAESVDIIGNSANPNLAPTLLSTRVSEQGSGKAGNLSIETGELRVIDRANVSASTSGTGNAGNISITADSVELTRSGGIFSQVNSQANGNSGQIKVTANSLSVTDNARISTRTIGQGTAGNINILANTLQISENGQILSDTASNFAAGNINITLGNYLLLSGAETGLFAQTSGKGNAGQININTPQVFLSGGASITASTTGEGKAGTVNIQAQNRINLKNNSEITSSARENATGESGNVIINSGRLEIFNNSGIAVSNQGLGNGGNLELQAGRVLLDNGSTLSAQTANGQGGNITLNLTNSLLLRNGSSITATAGTAQSGGDGGNISINAPYILAISNDNSDISANAFEGNGGNIQITADALFGIEPRDNPTLLNDITASSQFGTSGTVQINNATIRPNIELAKADISPVDPSTLIAQNVCKKGSQSEFTITGRGGLPPNPTAPLSPKIIWEDVGKSKVATHNSKVNSPLVEANNWHLAPTGQITLIASNSPDTQTLLEQGQERYRGEEFKEAINLWQNAANLFKSQGDNLNYAKTLSYLALAYQKLGQWEQSIQSITDSVQILKNNLSNPNSLPILAGAFNNQGNLELELGQGVSAVESFKQAEQLYQQAGDEEGRIYSILNQAYALQTLGLNRQALQLLYPLYQNQQQPDSLLKAKIYQNFGEALQLVGNLELSETVLQKSLIIAQNSQAYSDIGAIYLNLGNIARTKQDSSTLNYYQNALNVPSATRVKLQAKINQFSYLVNQNQMLAAKELIPDIQAQIANLPPSRTRIYAQINYAQSLTQLAQKYPQVTIPPTDIIQLLTTTLQQARELGDKRAEAYTLGYLGGFYQQNQQFSQAQEFSQQALSLSESIQAEDIAYLWQWQLGQILKAQGKQTEAIAFYTQAYNTLERLRQDLVGINSDIEFSFRETIEPVYRQLVALLLEGTPTQTNLSQARNIIESLQLAELNNFFQDACTQAKPQQIDQIDPKAAVIYSIILPNSLEIILSLAQQPLRHYSIPIEKNQLEQVYEEFWASLNPYLVSDNSLRPKQQLYDWLIRPFEQELKTYNIHTIVTVLDGVLRGIPLAALHDGKQYLVENYNLALTPGLQLLESQPSSSEHLKTLVGGLAEARQGFSPLPGVEQEVQDIAQTFPTQILLNQDFTRSRLQKQLAQNSYPLVHLATHGQFSSVAEKTFLLTWDGQIKINELKDLLQRQKTFEPIELLILSACQTATGDNKAALGLAGVAVRSGARSTLATLWAVEDQSTAQLMKQFYSSLSQPGMTKAEALRQAQLILLHSSDYQHPYYWAPFVLVGHWL